MLKAIALKRNLLVGVMFLFVAVIVAPGRSLANLDDGLVAHWNFDEGSGSTLHDVAPGHTGV